MSFFNSAVAASTLHPVYIDQTQLDALSLEKRDNTLQLSTMGRDLHFSLQASRHNQIQIKHQGNPGPRPALFSGTADGDPYSWVRINIIEGQISGHVFMDDRLHRLVPYAVAARRFKKDIPDSAMLMFDLAQQTGETNFSGVDNVRFAPQAETMREPAISPPVTVELQTAAYTSSELRNTIPGVTRVMRIGIVIDSLFNEYHGGRGLAVALSTIDAVDAIYQSQLGIAILVETIKVFDDPATDPLRKTSKSSETILNFFREQRLHDQDLPRDLTLVHLFTGNRDEHNVLGLGWIGTACRLDGHDISMSTPVPFGTLLTAHEIAHNFGAFHDDDTQCQSYALEDRTTLMWRNLNGRTGTSLSSCSKQYMQSAIHGSCNLDNIDLALSLQAKPADNAWQRKVNIQVSNKDVYRNARNFSSETTFKEGTLLSNPSTGCAVLESTLHCQYDNIEPNANSIRSVLATLTTANENTVESKIELTTIADLNGTDNRVRLDLLQFDDDGSALAVESSTPIAAPLTTAAASNSLQGQRIGSLSALGFLLLLLASQRLHHLRQNKTNTK